MVLRDGLRSGLTVLSVLLFLSLLGLPLTLGAVAVPVFAIATGILSLLALRPRDGQSRALLNATANGLLAGLVGGAGLALVTGVVARLQADGVQVHDMFAQLLPDHTAALVGLTKADIREGVDVTAGLVRIVGYMAAGGLTGGLLSVLFTEQGRDGLADWRQTTIAHWTLLALPIVVYGAFLALGLPEVQIGGSDENLLGLMLIFMFIIAGLAAFRDASPGKEKLIVSLILIALLLILPQFTDQRQDAILGKVAIFVTVGVGLNIVIGYAGLLDLGYVGFFAIGAYAFGMLAAPESYILEHFPNFTGLNFWAGLPISIGFGILLGLMIGIPVLRLRSDYLAIVTLGFGQIIRLLLLNLRDYTGGPGGVLNIPAPVIFGLDLGNPRGILYLAMLFGALAILLSVRLRDSRTGRAWIAMREDEDAARVMGVNTVSAKLLAFAIGAAFAGAAGSLYAAQQVNIFPDNFRLEVSIDILSMVIIGGLGSIEGVVLGSIALIGLPELLRGVDEYRIVAFGAMLVIMMIVRPEGLMPSARRRRELHETDRDQDAWLKAAADTGTSAEGG